MSLVILSHEHTPPIKGFGGVLAAVVANEKLDEAIELGYLIVDIDLSYGGNDGRGFKRTENNNNSCEGLVVISQIRIARWR